MLGVLTCPTLYDAKQTIFLTLASILSSQNKKSPLQATP